MNMAATCSSDRKIAIWDLRRVQAPLFVNEESVASVTACDFSVDQKAVITANFAGRINIIDIETRERRVDYNIMMMSDDEEENMCFHIKSIKNFPGGGNNFVLSSGIGIPIVINYEGHHEQELHRLE